MSPTDKSATDKSAKETLLSFFDLSETRLYIVLGLIAALVLIALIQACCTIMKTSRKNKNTKVCLETNPPVANSRIDSDLKH